MKNFKINLADGLALILLIISVFAPFFASSIKLNPNVLIMLINCYIISYISYIISFTDTKKVLAMALPLLIYTALLIILKRGLNLINANQLIGDLSYIITNLFDVMFVSFAFFLVELVLNRILGTRFTIALAILGLLLYLVMQNTNILPFDIYYKDLLAYFSFYVMAARLRPAAKMNKLLYPLAIVLFVGEIIAHSYYKTYPGIYLSLYLLTYIILKDMDNIERINQQRYLSFAYLYPYPVLNALLGSVIKASPLVVTIMATLATYVLGQLIYKLRFKVLDYLFVGVH